MQALSPTTQCLVRKLPVAPMTSRTRCSAALPCGNSLTTQHHRAAFSNAAGRCRAAADTSTSSCQRDVCPQTQSGTHTTTSLPAAAAAAEVFMTTFGIFLLTEAPAMADSLDAAGTSPFSGVQANSLWVTLGLFVLCVPGIWSQIKRAPLAKKVRKTFEVDGPSKPGAVPIDDRARQVFRYFKQYNYDVKETGEVITFTGTYSANRGQAAAVTFYTFAGLGSIALVLSTAFQDIGGWFYLLTLLSPGAWFYYMGKGTRQEEVKVKMLTADDDMTTDILVEGDTEEIERFRKELGLMEKGKVYVKGLLEN